MKNILKKIGLIGIIIGVLSPFITLPSVNAASSCRRYLNQYLFYDVAYSTEFINYADNSGYTTYTSFIYDYPTLTSNQEIIFGTVDELEINTNDLLEEFHGNVITLTKGTKDEIRKIEKMGTLITNSINQIDISTHLHGYWNKEGESGRESAGWDITSNVNEFTDEKTIQGRMINGSERNRRENDLDLQTTFGGATYDVNRNRFGYASGYNSIESYVSNVVTEVSTGGTNAINNNHVYEETKNGVTTKYINFRINRKLDADELNELIFGYEQESGQFVAYSTTKTTSFSEITDSFDALNDYVEYSNGIDANSDGNFCNDGTSTSKVCYLVPVDKDQIDYYNGNDYEYYWPTVLQVEYQVCNTDNTPITNPDKNWTLTYDRGVSDEEVKDVLNMPDKKTNITTSTVTLDDKKPERKDFEFKEWCTEKDGKGTCVEAGKVFENKDMTDKTLYAYWVKPGAGDPEKQGVISYVLGFAGIGIIAYGLYYVINKKNLFKQI